MTIRALCLGGGGSRGAVEVGVIDYLLEKNPDLNYDIIGGVSVGALNAALLAETPLSQSFPKLKDIWLNQVKGNKSVWTHHLWNYIFVCILIIVSFSLFALGSFILEAPKWLTLIFCVCAIVSFYLPYQALNTSHSIYKNDPLRYLVSSNLDVEKLKHSQSKLVIGAVSFTTGKYKSITKIDNNIVDWIMASSAVPIFFPMSYIDGEHWIDGGVINIIPLDDILAMGATEIDVIITAPLKTEGFYGQANLAKQVMRNIDIMTFKFLQNDIVNELAKRDIKIRFFIIDKELSTNSLDFSPDKIKIFYQEGRKLAEKVLLGN